MSSVVYPATALTGGTSECLDAYDGNDLNANDIAMVSVPASKVYFYYLDDACSLSESPPNVIAPDDNPGTKRWRLLQVQDFDFGGELSSQYGVYNVLDYGAVGDGATDDYEAILNTILAANTAGGGIVWFPPLTFYCSHWIYPNVELNNITLKGAPGNEIYFGYTNGAAHNFAVYGNHITFDGIHINTSVVGTNDQGSTIVVLWGSYITIQNCFLENSAGAAIYFQGYAGTGSTYYIDNFLVTNNFIYKSYGTLFACGSTNGVVSNNVIRDVGDDAIGISWNGLDTDDGVYNWPHGIVVSGNQIHDVWLGKGIDVNHAYDVEIIGNIVTNCEGAGLGIYAWKYETDYVASVDGNTITVKNGLDLTNRYKNGYLNLWKDGEAYLITSNTTTTVTVAGTLPSLSVDDGFTIEAMRAYNIRAIGNTFSYCGGLNYAGDGLPDYDNYAAVYFNNAEYCTFKDNVIYAPQSYDEDKSTLLVGGLNIGCIHDGHGGGSVRNLEISGNQFQNINGKGIMFDSGTYAKYVKNVVIKNNTFTTVAHEAIYSSRTTARDFLRGDVIIDGNMFYFCAYDADVYGDAAKHHVVIDGIDATSWIYYHRNGTVKTAYTHYFDNYTLLDTETGGGGGLSGPLSSTDHSIVRWDGVDGSTLQNCGITVDDSNIMTWPSSTTGCNLVANPTHAGGPAYFQIALNANAGQYNQLKIRGTTVGSYGSVAAYFSDGSTAEGIVLAHDGSNGLLLTDATDGTILVKPQGTLAMTIAPTSVTVPSLLYTTSASAASNLICTNTPGSSNSLLQVIMNAPSGYYNQLLVYGSVAGSYGSIGAYYGTKSTAEGIVMYHNGSNAVIASDATDGDILVKPGGSDSVLTIQDTGTNHHVSVGDGTAVSRLYVKSVGSGSTSSTLNLQIGGYTKSDLFVLSVDGGVTTHTYFDQSGNLYIRSVDGGYSNVATLSGSGLLTLYGNTLTEKSATNSSYIVAENTPGAGPSYINVKGNAPSGQYNQLRVYGTVAGGYGSVAAYYSQGTTTEGIVMYHNGSNGVIDTDVTDSTLLIKAGGTQVMSVASSGHLTVGTNAGTRYLYLNSSGDAAFYLQSSGSSKAYFSISGNYTYIGYGSSGLYLYRASTLGAYLNSSGDLAVLGKVYIGDTSSPTKYLYLDGNDLYWYDGASGTKLN